METEGFRGEVIKKMDANDKSKRSKHPFLVLFVRPEIEERKTINSWITMHAVADLRNFYRTPRPKCFTLYPYLGNTGKHRRRPEARITDLYVCKPDSFMTFMDVGKIVQKF